MRHLALRRHLQRVVVGVDRILPLTQAAEIAVQPVTQPRQRPAEVVGRRNAWWQEGAGLPVDVFSSKQLVAGGANVARLHHRLRQDLALNTQVEVVHVRVAYALRWDDPGQHRKVRVIGIPPNDVACVLGLSRRTLIWIAPGSSLIVHGHVRILRANGGWAGGAGAWPVDYIGARYPNAALNSVKRIVGRVPARVRERVV